MNTELQEYLKRIEQALVLGSKEVLTLNEAVMLTGLKPSGMYALTRNKEIPHYKRGQKLYFKKSELEAWMTEYKIKSNEEINIEAATYLALRS